MSDECKIFISDLKAGQQKSLRLLLAPSSLNLLEESAIFADPVRVSLEAECCDEMLVLSLSAETEAKVSCIICNERLSVAVKVDPFVITRELLDIKHGLFDFAFALREAILLEGPYLKECNQGSCPERKEVEKYFVKRGD